MISIVEAAEQKMKECSDDDINAVDTVVLLPDNVDSLTDDEEAQDNHVMIDNGFPSDIFGTKTFLGGEDNENIGEDDGNAESRAQDEKEKRALELMKYVEECKSKPKNWINKYPAKVQLLEPINRDSKSIKHTKNDIANNWKTPSWNLWKVCKCWIETYNTTTNTATSFNIQHLETFKPILLLTGYHSLSHE